MMKMILIRILQRLKMNKIKKRERRGTIFPTLVNAVGTQVLNLSCF